MKVTTVVGAIEALATCALLVAAWPLDDSAAIPTTHLGVPFTGSDVRPAEQAWTEWRGPARDGSVPAGAEPGEWPTRPVRLWEREVGGGYSGPIVAGDRVWIHSRQGGMEVVSSLSLGGGETLWSQRYQAVFDQNADALAHGRGPYATPVLAGGRLFTFGVTSILSAWDARSGALLWRRDFSGESDHGYPIFGVAGSPLVWEDLCFVHVGEMGWGRPGRGAMVALDVADGRERWRWADDAPSAGSSPVVPLIGGEPQLVFKSQEHIVGLDPRSGRPLWQIRYEVPQDNTIVTPLFIGDVLVTSDWDMGLHAWRIELQEGTWSARKLWESRAASIFTSSPVAVRVADGAGENVVVVGFSHFNRGQLFGLDPTTGEALWRGPGRAGEHVSLVATGNELLVFGEDGSLVVGRVSRKDFQPQRTYRLGWSGTWAHPAIAGDVVVVRDGERLIALRFERTPG